MLLSQHSYFCVCCCRLIKSLPMSGSYGARADCEPQTNHSPASSGGAGCSTCRCRVATARGLISAIVLGFAWNTNARLANCALTRARQPSYILSPFAGEQVEGAPHTMSAAHLLRELITNAPSRAPTLLASSHPREHLSGLIVADIASQLQQIRYRAGRCRRIPSDGPAKASFAHVAASQRSRCALMSSGASR